MPSTSAHPKGTSVHAASLPLYSCPLLRRAAAEEGSRVRRGREVLMTTELMDRLSRIWGLLVLRGLAAILFGVLAFVWPGITLAALVLVWGAYALVDGLCALIASLRLEEGKPMWTLTLVGLLGIAAGLLTLLWPQITALVLLVFIAGWAVVMGVFQLAAAIRFR